MRPQGSVLEVANACSQPQHEPPLHRLWPRVILLPWTHEISPETAAAVAGFPNLPAYVGGSDDAYWELLAEWWKSDELYLMTVEHDVIPTTELLEEMIACEEEWCAAVYPFEAGAIYGLGCTRFDLTIRQAVPDLMDQVALQHDVNHKSRHWCSNDMWMQLTLRRLGHDAHLHRSADIQHLGRVRSHVACREGTIDYVR